jgi:hypothetical protein
MTIVLDQRGTEAQWLALSRPLRSGETAKVINPAGSQYPDLVKYGTGAMFAATPYAASTASDAPVPTAFSSLIDFRSNKSMPVSSYYAQAGAINFTKDTTGAVPNYGTTILLLADGNPITFTGFEMIGAGATATAGQKQVIDFVWSGGLAFASVALGAATVVTPSIPTNSSVPVISGTTTQGQTLTTTTGTWTNTPTTYAYQWRRGGTAISGATSSTYTLVSADVGTVITVAVIATNAGGSSTAAISAGTATIAAPATPVPVNSVAPAISGTAQVGQTLTVSNGTWSNTPTSYAYQWKRAGTNISGATAQTYVPVTADVGNTLTCAVTASNANGAGTAATSAATAAVTAASLPTISDSSTGRADSTGSTASMGPNWETMNGAVMGIRDSLWDVESFKTTGIRGGATLQCNSANGTYTFDLYTGQYSKGQGVLLRRIDDNNFLYTQVQADRVILNAGVAGTLYQIKQIIGGDYSDYTVKRQCSVTLNGANITVVTPGGANLVVTASDFATASSGGPVTANTTGTKFGFTDISQYDGRYNNFNFVPA